MKVAQVFQEIYQEFEQKGMERGMEKGMERGMERGETTKALEVARKMLALNMNTETIKEITGLPLAEILKLMH
ncbi:hypothetical protein LR013_00350 [candidate division NPL-UPA2 bacterium]|nr:hypothetical protein [candidate division NPL-UPA2 bacterium]